MHVGQVEAGGEGLIIAADLLVSLLRVIDDVHLVDGDDDVLDAQQRDDESVPLGLHQDAVAGVDQNDGQVGGRCAGRHVAGVLLVARRIGDDEFAFVRREIAVRDVDRDPLLPLVLQAIGEQRQVDFACPVVPNLVESFLIAAS